MSPFSDWKNTRIPGETKFATLRRDADPQVHEHAVAQFERDALGDDGGCVHVQACAIEVVHERRRRDDVIRTDDAGRDDVVGLDDHGIGGHRDHRVEIARGQRVREVAEVVGEERVDEREVRAQCGLDEVILAAHVDLLLALLDDGTDAGRGEDTAEPEATRADALDQRALRHELDLHFAGQHLLLRFRIQADVADDRLAHQPGAHQLADADAGKRRVVGDDGQVALALARQFVDDAVRRADGHEAADHQARAVRDEGNGLLEGYVLHPVGVAGQRYEPTKRPAAPSPPIWTM